MRRCAAIDDFVVVTGSTYAKSRESGIETRLHWGQGFRLRDGKVVWSRIYADKADAMKVVGPVDASR